MNGPYVPAAMLLREREKLARAEEKIVALERRIKELIKEFEPRKWKSRIEMGVKG